MIKLDTVYDPVLKAHSEYLDRIKQTVHWPTRDEIGRLREYGTVRIGFGRQNGHSCYIARMATSRDMIICKDRYHVDTFSGRTACFGVSGCTNIATISQVISAKPDTLLPVDAVWVDDASYIKTKDMDALYKTLAGYCRRIILIK